jgi:protein gp37
MMTLVWISSHGAGASRVSGVCFRWFARGCNTGDKSGIEWTDATWNPTVGCKRVSPGCDHCYAFALHDQRHIAWKRGRMPNAPEQYHQPFSVVQMMPERLDLPLRWRKPRRVFDELDERPVP